MRKIRIASILFFGFAALRAQTVPPPSPAAPTATEDRVGIALLIGNSKYNQAELPAVRVDEQKFGKALQSLGFEVTVVEDLPRPRDFEDTLRGFLRDANARPEDILLVYYSGHGIQLEGKPQLLGTGVTPSSDMNAGLRAYSEPVDRVIDIMEQAAPSARVLIVDACRNSPFAGAARRAGVSFQNQVEDTYIVFADEPGKTVPARSQTEFQSPFTAGLLFAFETSSGGIEERFELGRAKTRELSPDQNPQLLKSSRSADRHKPFLDAGGRRAVNGQSAPQLLDLSKKAYEERRWSIFSQQLRTARALSTDPQLSARLDREMQFGDLVQAAQAAEADVSGPKWAAAAASWQKAGKLFPARAWVHEKAALCWLLADNLQEAVTLLARLQTRADSADSTRYGAMLDALVKYDSALDAVAKSALAQGALPTGPEFEGYSPNQ
jgi:uncharacterized caspase-like protein